MGGRRGQRPGSGGRLTFGGRRGGGSAVEAEPGGSPSASAPPQPRPSSGRGREGEGRRGGGGWRRASRQRTGGESARRRRGRAQPAGEGKVGEREHDEVDLFVLF